MFYEISQIAAKCVLTAIVLWVAVMVLVRIWCSDIDLKEWLNPVKFAKTKAAKIVEFPSREPDKVYQNGKAVGTVSGAIIDVDANSIRFARIDHESMDENKEVEFQRWRIQFLSMTASSQVSFGAGPPEQTLKDSVWKIVGTR